ncbi:MAG: hypothetical protein PUE16_08640 [Lactimicrobium massiliense]|nr:hypothetical protein [Lactimicrobium massiliense]MDD6727383.1 hypothetical protein [Lactimicrobium massiliense]
MRKTGNLRAKVVGLGELWGRSRWASTEWMQCFRCKENKSTDEMRSPSVKLWLNKTMGDLIMGIFSSIFGKDKSKEKIQPYHNSSVITIGTGQDSDDTTEYKKESIESEEDICIVRAGRNGPFCAGRKRPISAERKGPIRQAHSFQMSNSVNC